MFNRVQRVPRRTEPSRVSGAVRGRPAQRHLELPDCASHPLCNILGYCMGVWRWFNRSPPRIAALIAARRCSLVWSTCDIHWAADFHLTQGRFQHGDRRHCPPPQALMAYFSVVPSRPP